MTEPAPPMRGNIATEPEREPWLTHGVAGISLASLLSDAGHEITTALLPSFITQTLGASASALGLIEGISDALAGVAGLLVGPLANDTERRRQIATGGYLATAAATGAIGLTTGVWQAGILRAVAWSSRGARSTARDSMLASIAKPHTYGRAFGLERAGDNLGAVIGPLLAAGFVAWLGIRPALLLAAVPGVLATFAIAVAAREARDAAPRIVRRARFEIARLRRAGALIPLVPITMFELGNVATTLLILRATGLLHHHGASLTDATSAAVLIYAAHNLVAAIIALAGGHWIDRVGPRHAFALGSAVYVLGYLGFASGWSSPLALIAAFSLAGAGIGLAETAESTMFAHAVPDELRGSGFGLLSAVQAFGDFASSAVAGVLYALVSPAVAFIYAAGWMVLATATTSVWIIRDRRCQ